MIPTRRLAAALLAGALLAGCSGAGPDDATDDNTNDGAGPQTLPSAAPGATPPPLPAGYQGIAVAEAGFGIAVPVGWKQAEEPAPSKFQAFSPDDSGGNVNVLANPAQGFELGDLEREYADALKSGINAINVQVKRVRTAAGEALRASYRAPLQSPGGQNVAVDAVQYVHILGGIQYILTVTLLGEQVTRKVADTIGRSFFLL